MELSTRFILSMLFGLCAGCALPPAPSSPGGQESSKKDASTQGDGPQATPEVQEESKASKPKEIPIPQWPKVEPKARENAGFELLRSQRARELEPHIDASTLLSMRTGNNDLAFDLLRSFVTPNSGNAAVSPVSVQAAMGLVLAASTGQTRDELRVGLGFADSAQRTHAALNLFRLRLAALQEAGDLEDAVRMSVNNAVFLLKEYEPSSVYLDTLAQHYGTGVYQMEDTSSETESKINAWVTKNTNGLIEDFFPEGSLSSQTVWTFVNAIYMKAPFSSEVFDESDTRLADFTLLDSSKVDVEMMHGSQWEATTGETKDFRWGVLPLGQQEELETIWILPKKGRFPETLAQLSAEGLSDFYHRSTTCILPISLPKFSLRTGSRSIASFLQERGVRRLFGTDGQAELPGLGLQGAADIAYVSDVLHSVVVEVDENGVEAAAVTGGGGDTSDGGLERPEPKRCKKMVFDRPFLFLVYEKTSKLVVFAGSVTDPSQG